MLYTPKGVTGSYLKRILAMNVLLGKTTVALIVIHDGYPQVKKNSCGYRLDPVLNDRGFCLHKLFAG